MKQLLFLIFTPWLLFSFKPDTVTLVLPENSHPRITYGVDQLKEALSKAGYEVSMNNRPEKGSADGNTVIVIGRAGSSLVRQYTSSVSKGKEEEKTLGAEAFSIVLGSGSADIIITGGGASGSMYGAMELADRIEKEGAIPDQLAIIDQPEMKLRGACIGLQKMEILHGRKAYEYPYTPENFPWFYDKQHWIDYLDMLAENRYNSLYLWNGHPFASLVKLDDYPYAVEVSDETFKKNEEMFRFITREADKRGIWIIQMFYNIIVSKPFAEKHSIVTQDRSRPITPLIADYTRKSIAAFVEKYPNVGLLVALGEAMSGDKTDVKWFTETIIPGVKDGLEVLGKTDEPPIVLRGHDTNPRLVMKKALPLYKNLYTMSKYNGEALTTYQPRGPWAEQHRDLSSLGSTHIDNVHILANLEPFRYGSPNFIQKSVQAMHETHGANGLHLYPQASYWDWPYTADKTESRLLQIDRDWIWYKAWGRYAWDANRDRNKEISYWGNLLGDKYGCTNCGRQILKAYEESGEISPKLLRRFGITNGNRQTFTLGMFMSQLVNPHKWRVWKHLYDSDGPKGEMLIEYAEKEWKGQPHEGETPPQIIEEVVEHGRLAVRAIDEAVPQVTQNEEEFSRLRNDIYCYNELAQFYHDKIEAAMQVLRYKYSRDIADLGKALPYLQNSVEHFKKLAELTDDTYLYANSMQTAQRRVPISGHDGKNITWSELLIHYKEELENFKDNLASLKSGTVGQEQVRSLSEIEVQLSGPQVNRYSVGKGQQVFTDKGYQIGAVAQELQKMQGVKISMEEQQKRGTHLQFSSETPFKVLVGFFNSNEEKYLSPVNLETNASANNRGQADVKLANAIAIQGLPPVNIHTYAFEAGEHTLSLDKGACLILGFMDGNEEITLRDAGVTEDKSQEQVDWLFY